MSNALADLARRWRFNDEAAKGTTAGFEDADWTTTAGECQPAWWIIGHLATSRRSFARMAGADVAKEDWEAHFKRGSKAGDELPMPGRDLFGQFLKAGEILFARMDAMTEDDAAKEGGPFPDGSTTVGGALGFGYFHETYHVGQLGLLRRINGKEGFV